MYDYQKVQSLIDAFVRQKRLRNNPLIDVDDFTQEVHLYYLEHDTKPNFHDILHIYTRMRNEARKKLKHERSLEAMYEREEKLK